jgi:hypothetical protein
MGSYHCVNLIFLENSQPNIYTIRNLLFTIHLTTKYLTTKVDVPKGMNKNTIDYT